MTSLTIWFWQRMITPHMVHLAEALARRGHEVTYVAEEELSAERKAQGWELPELKELKFRFATNAEEAVALVRRAPLPTIHLTQGFRSNGHVATAQGAIKLRGQKHLVIMEGVDQRGVTGLLKPCLYTWHLHKWRRGVDAVLAIGAETPNWLRRLGPKQMQVLPFAYFLPEQPLLALDTDFSRFRFVFVGSLIPRKRPDLFLRTLGSLSGYDFEVEIVGDGPMRVDLEVMAEKLLPGRVFFQRVVPISEISRHIEKADCLVLPSSHDGWGAVVSEALMVGTPVICSEACGSRIAVQTSGEGGVFNTFDKRALRKLLEAAVIQGKVNPHAREALRSWAKCLGADAGARYLETILMAITHEEHFTTPPWE